MIKQALIRIGLLSLVLMIIHEVHAVDVTNWSELKAALTSTSSESIIVKGDIDCGNNTVVIGSNTSIYADETLGTRPKVSNLRIQIKGNYNFHAKGIDFEYETSSSAYFLDLAGASTSISQIKIEDCAIHGYGRSFVRADHSTNIATIAEIVIDKTLIYDMGIESAGYSMLALKTALLTKLTISNSTIYNCASSFFYSEVKNNALEMTCTNITMLSCGSNSEAKALFNANTNPGSTYTFVNCIIDSSNAAAINMASELSVTNSIFSASMNSTNTTLSESSQIIAATVTSFDSSSLKLFLSDSSLQIGDLYNLAVNPSISQAVTLQLSVDNEKAGTASASPTAGSPIEKGTEVTLTASPYYGYIFSSWQDSDGNLISTSNPHTFTINDNTTLKAIFEKSTSFIAAWDFSTISGDGKNQVTAEYGQSTAKLCIYDQNGTLSGGRAMKGRFGKDGLQIHQAVDSGRDGYFEAQFSTEGYANISINSSMLAYYFSYLEQKVMYAVGDGEFKDASNYFTINANSWTACNAFLPADANNQAVVKVRWYPNVAGDNTGSAYPTSGNETALAEVFILADQISSTSYTRNFYTDGGLETLCLPFDVSAITDGLGKDITAQLEAWEYKGDGEAGNVKFSLVTDGLKAHVPYLVSLSDANVGKRAYTLSGTEAAEVAPVVSLGGYSFVGTYAGYQSAIPTHYVLNTAGDAFVEAIAASIVPAYRAYLTPNSGGAQAKTVVIDFNDDVTALCPAAETNDEGRLTIYSLAEGLKITGEEGSLITVVALDGRPVRSFLLIAGEVFVRLPKGIYLVNNQKAIVQ